MKYLSRVRSLFAACLMMVGALVALIAPTQARAHFVNQTYVYFDVAPDSLSGRIEVTLLDLAKILQGSTDIAGPLPLAEVAPNLDRIKAYFTDHFALEHEGKRLTVVFEEPDFFDAEPGTFAQLNFRVEGLETTPLTIEMSYDAIFSDADPSHRGYALIATNSRTGMDENEAYISLVFAPGDGQKTLYLNDESSRDTLLSFAQHGIGHFWLGLDHLLFFVALLASAVMIRREGAWVPVEGVGPALTQTFMVVLLLGLAKALGLWLAALGTVALPGGVAEVLIALSLVLVAGVILFPGLPVSLWLITLLFALIHGFGYAGALDPLGLDAARRVLGVAGFIFGVGLGMLAVTFVLFPIFFALRRTSAYGSLVLRAGPVLLLAFAAFLLVQRLFGAPFLYAGILG